LYPNNKEELDLGFKKRFPFMVLTLIKAFILVGIFNMRSFFFILCLGSCIFLPLLISSKKNSTPLSRSFLTKSLHVQDLGPSFVLQLPHDQSLYQLAKSLIFWRKKDFYPKKNSTIPKTIHQIWPFNEPLTDELARAASLLKALHPDFSYKLWRPSDFGPLLQAEIGDKWENLPPCLIRDIAAAYILIKEGGIVIDLETEYVQRMDELLTYGDCLLTIEPPLPKPQYERRLFVSPSFIASTQGHVTITKWAELLLARVSYLKNNNQADPLYISLDSLTSAVFANSPEKTPGLLLLGPAFFSPVAPSQIKDLNRKLDGLKKRSFAKKAASLLHLTSVPPFSEIDDETIAIHMNGGRLSRKCFNGLSITQEVSLEEAQP
jgi:hypothetical protein